MTEPGPQSTRSPVSVVAGATILSAAAGYGVILIAARLLGPEKYYDFSVFWAALYLVVGAIFGVQQEMTRGVRAGHAPGARTTPVFLPAAIIGAALAVLVGATAVWWSGTVFHQDEMLFILLIAAGAILYSGQAALAGALAGRAEWKHYSLVLTSEAVGRLVLVAIAAAVVISTPSLAVVTVAAMGIWLLWLASPTVRAAAGARVDGGLMTTTRRAAQSLIASASTALMVTGFPVLLAIASRKEDEPADLAIVILVVTLTRAPIMLPLNAFLGMIVASFVDRRADGTGVVIRPLLWVAGGGVALAALAGLVGPALLTFLFGPSYRADGWFIAGATLGAAMVGVISITGAAELAISRHAVYAVGWILAASVTFGLLFLPIDLGTRTVIALVVGPIVGAAVHLVDYFRASDRAREARRP